MVIMCDDSLPTRELDRAHLLLKCLGHMGILPSVVLDTIQAQRSTSAGWMILLTRKWRPNDKPSTEWYAGVARRYGDKAWLVHIPPDISDNMLAFWLAHEMIHVAGGDELDAETAEHLVARYVLRTPGLARITDDEKRDFLRHTKGKFYHITYLTGPGDAGLWAHVVTPKGMLPLWPV